MKPSDALSKDARALLRAARGGDDIPAAERQRVLQAFRQRPAVDDAVSDAVDDRAPGAPGQQHGARASRGGQRRALSRPVRRAAWAVAALISTGSVAALAREGAFEGWGAALQRMLGALAGESSTVGVERAVDNRAPLALPQVSASEKVMPERAAVPEVREFARAAGEPMPGARQSSPDAEHPTEPAGDALPAANPSGAKQLRQQRADLRAPRPRAKAPTPEPRASQELDLIITARNALAGRRHSDARAAADRHALEFPSGVFVEEREAILALCACRATGASERARAFIKRRPDSLFAERIRKDCELAPNLVPGAHPAGTHQESPRDRGRNSPRR